MPSLKAVVISWTAGDKNVEVGRDAEQELRGNGAAVEKCDEMRAPVPEPLQRQAQPPAV